MSFVKSRIALVLVWKAVATALALSATESHAAWRLFRPCAWLLTSNVQLDPFEDFVDVRGIPVTGEDLYTTPVILRNLDFDEASTPRMRNLKVLSIGEGFSGLVPFLRNHGIAADGLDLWYGNKNFPQNDAGQKMRRFVSDNRKYLITGGYEAIPLKSKIYDLVVSHMLVNNIREMDQVMRLIDEAIRVTKSGGEVRIHGLNESQTQQLSDGLMAKFANVQSHVFLKKEFEYQSDGLAHSRSDFLLKMTLL